MRIKVEFEVEIDSENHEGMTPKEYADLTYKELDEGELPMNEFFDMADWESFKVSVV